jgi:hypothetical protein
VAKRKIYDDKKAAHIKYIMQKALQSAKINFLIGSGASLPAIKVAGPIEQEIDKLFNADDINGGNRKKHEFIQSVQKPITQLLRNEANPDNDTVINNYGYLIHTLENVLIARKTNLLPKQATIFTTNYDLFIEKAAEDVPSLRLNDGFNRAPSLTNRFEFSPQNFFDSTFKSGNLYDYKVELPAINLIKLHGSLSWKKNDSDILHRINSIEDLPPAPSDDDIKNYLEQFAIIFPQKHKYQKTVMDRIYYDLLRIYSNELDKNTTLLIAFGFSFADEHICDITKRALKNPTLKMIIFAYSVDEAKRFDQTFSVYNNVDIIEPLDGENIDFDTFNSILAGSINQSKEETNAD